MRKLETIEQVFESYLESLALTRRPGTIGRYRATLRGFVRFLSNSHPEVRKLSQLRRDPHIQGWLASLSCFRNCTRIHQIYDLRRCLRDHAAEGRYGLREDLIVPRDFPRPDVYLPRPLSPEDDLRICDQLRKRGKLESTALLLMRATGMRVGECLNLAVDCLRDLGDNQWAIQVPLGKMHTERWVPLDDHARSLVDSLLAFRKQAPASVQASSPFLLLWKDGERLSWKRMRTELRRAARKSGSSVPRVTSHQLRHTFATEMLRGGASLPAVKTLLGHTKIEMTLRYVQVSQVDLQREYKSARANLASLYQLPRSSMPHYQSAHPYVHALESLANAAHFIEMHRRNLDNPRQELTLRRLLNRLTKVASALKRLQRTQPTAGKK